MNINYTETPQEHQTSQQHDTTVAANCNRQVLQEDLTRENKSETEANGTRTKRVQEEELEKTISKTAEKSNVRETELLASGSINKEIERNQQDDENVIEWLSPHPTPRARENEIETTVFTESNNGETASASIEPLNMIRKGAVAAVGGTMTAVGLVMIPLPTPFGAVIASSGLAVLGTEFDEAKELNDRLIEGAKDHLNNAREALVNGIESMDQDVCNANDSGSSTCSFLTDSSEKEVRGEANAVVKVDASATFGNDSCDSDGSGPNQNSPMWL